jgi:hypothetical protein
MPDDERDETPNGSHHGDDELRIKPDRRQRYEVRFRGSDGRRAEDLMPEPAPGDDPDPTSKN